MKVNIGWNKLTMAELAQICGGMLCYVGGDNNKEILYTYDANGNILTKAIDGEIVEYKDKENSDQLISFGE